MDLLDMLVDAVRDDALTADDGPHTHGLRGQGDRTIREEAGRLVRTYLCMCGQTFKDDLWDLHLSSHPDPRPEPATVNGASIALGEHGRQLYGDLAQRMSACLVCGHAKILHGKVNGRLPLDAPLTRLNGDCTHCQCRTYRRHADLGKIANTRAIWARDRAERETT